MSSEENYIFLDYNYDQTASTHVIYEFSVKPLVQQFLLGKNCCVLSYGPAQSGKTFSFYGSREENDGLVQMVVDGIFKGIEGTTLRKYLLR